MNNKIKTIFSFLFSALFLYLAFRKIELRELLLALRESSWLVVLSASLMAILTMVIRAWRWNIILNALRPTTFYTAFAFTNIGFMINNLLPAHLGDLFKAYLIGKHERFSSLAALATVVVERLLDFITVSLMMVLLMWLMPVPIWMRNLGLLVGFFSSVLFTGILLLAGKGAENQQWAERISRVFPERLRSKTIQTLNLIFSGVATLRRGKVLLKLLAISLLQWTQMILTVLIVLTTLRGVNHLFLAASAAQIFVAYVVVVPSSPGYWGSIQLAFVMALSYFNVGRADALAGSLVYHLTQYIPVTLVGLWFFFKEGLSFKQVQRTRLEMSRDKTATGTEVRSGEKQGIRGRKTAHSPGETADD